MDDMPEEEQPLSEQFRIAARHWVEANKASRLFEELKTATLAKMKSNVMAEQGPMSDAAAERIVKSHADWFDYINKYVEAEAEANLSRVKMKWIELRHSEWMSNDANARKERGMGRQAT